MYAVSVSFGTVSCCPSEVLILLIARGICRPLGHLNQCLFHQKFLLCDFQIILIWYRSYCQNSVLNLAVTVVAISLESASCTSWIMSYLSSFLISDTMVVTIHLISSFFSMDVLIFDRLWWIRINSSEISVLLIHVYASVSELLMRCNFVGLLSDTVAFSTDDGTKFNCSHFFSAVFSVLFFWLLFSLH